MSADRNANIKKLVDQWLRKADHDLVVADAVRENAEVASFLNHKRGTLETISLYGVAARYPGVEQPTHEAALDALATAERVVQRIRTELSSADRK